MSILNFKSLLGDSGISLDGSNPNQITVNSVAPTPFDLQNVYYLASNGSNSNNGKSVGAPKATLLGANGIIANITNPTARNLINVLDGADYVQGSPVNIPDNMNITINAPEAKFTSITSDLFSLGALSRLYLYCRSIESNVNYSVAKTSINSFYHIYVNDVVRGDITNLNYTQCKLYVYNNFNGNIVTQNSSVSIVSGFILGSNLGTINGNFINELDSLPPIQYSSPSTINIDSSFIGKTIVANSSLLSSYACHLPNTRFAPGGYFYVLQAGEDPVIFSTTGGAILLSDQSASFVKTRVIGSMIRVSVFFNGTNNIWSISGDLTFL